jgi:DNA-binding MarR family transcriptional regulator
MNQIELNQRLANSLFQMYEMQAIEDLVEFWQGELRVLQFVYQHGDDEINPSDLSDALHVSRARITTALSALRKKGFISMEMCEDDRRRMRVLLTADGETFVKEKQHIVEKHFDKLVNGLGEDDVMELVRLIELSTKVLEMDRVN